MTLVGVPPPPGARRTPLPRAVLAHTRMELVLLLRSGESLLVTLGIPLGVLVFFSLVDILPTRDSPAVEFLVPGVLAISVMSTGLVSLGIATAFERKYGVLKLLGGSPLPRWALLAGKSLAVVVVVMAQTVLILVVAVWGLGWEAGGGAVPALVGLAVGAFSFSAIGLLLAGTLRAEATLAVANTLFLALLLVSGLAFDLDVLPAPVAALSRGLPSGALGQALRAALDADGGSVGGPLLVVAAWGLAATAVAARRFRWEP
ncbi:MAG TPA: ABC transporter permease [Nitriliruptorales bacterium]|nr:ABC transporter permease [Nitriliruptorales bacterium]